ncbi:uncharacterized protein N7529_006187 [Penicillium soppii]|uniref:uncharacterized protein n=1 Tax=Penicillium soppii TaxID=69789 RepID=UPI00254739A5|nr:uncharacterized protein N7529_006187 [Penicillium soppii]KAJ5864271.1 hypothetical protein N7529_006187 [Penicillium soppii]
MSHTFDDQTHGADITRLFPEQATDTRSHPSRPKRGDLAASTADALAAAGAATLICTGHCKSEIQHVIDHISRKYKKVNMVFVTADTSSLASFHEAGRTIKKMGLQIDGFIGFPSVMAVPWEMTGDGHESHFQRNYLCYFLLVNILLDDMVHGSRVVLVTSCVRTEAPAPTWVDVRFSNGEDYHCLEGYSQSMLAMILFAKSLSKMCGDRSIAAFSANPGNTKTNVQTYISMDQMESWLERKRIEGEEIPVSLQQTPKSLAQGSATILRGLLDPDLQEESGAFLNHCQALKLPHLDFPAGEESAQALWRRSQEFLGAFL